MTIKFVTGSIFNSTCEALVNPVNCVGVMGAGLAKEFKLHYPKNFEYYKKECNLYSYGAGDVIFTYHENGKWIINGATKTHWKNNSTYTDIQLLLVQIKSNLFIHQLKSCAIPALGCGLGGLSWENIKEIIIDTLSDCDVEFEVYEPVKKGFGSMKDRIHISDNLMNLWISVEKNISYKLGDEVWLVCEINDEIIKGVIERISNRYNDDSNSIYYVIQLEKENVLGETSTIYDGDDNYTKLFLNRPDAVNYLKEKLTLEINKLEGDVIALKQKRDNLQI